MERPTPGPQGLLYQVTAHDPAMLAEPWVRRPGKFVRQTASLCTNRPASSGAWST